MRHNVRVVEISLIFSLDESLKVQATVHQAVLHAKVVSGGQHFATRGAGEAVQVVDQVPRAHHHLRRGNAQMAPGAPLHRKSSADNTEPHQQLDLEPPGGLHAAGGRAVQLIIIIIKCIFHYYNIICLV